VLWPLLLPCALLLVGAAIGFGFSLDQRVAAERLLGLVLGSALAVIALLGLSRVERPAPILVTAAAVSLLAGLWVIAASGSDVFRGVVGQGLDLFFRPLFGTAQVTDSIEIGNTRFIVGYNGLADLCVVAIFCCGAVVLDRRRWTSARTLALVLVMGISLVVLIGTGARGALAGLLAGGCMVGLYVWPRRYALAALIVAPMALVLATFGLLDKGLEFSSTAGRVAYWKDLVRLLVDYPLTGVGLGVDTAFRATLQYEINPDPERVFYAHNTFVQSYLEMGPLGALGMALVPLGALAAIVVARQNGIALSRRPLLIAGLGVVGALTVHGLTDQVVTTNVGTTMLLLGFAAVLAALSMAAADLLARWTAGTALVLGVSTVIVLAALLALPVGRAQALLDLGSLKSNQALAMPTQAPERGAALADADGVAVRLERGGADGAGKGAVGALRRRRRPGSHQPRRAPARAGPVRHSPGRSCVSRPGLRRRSLRAGVELLRCLGAVTRGNRHAAVCAEHAHRARRLSSAHPGGTGGGGHAGSEVHRGACPLSAGADVPAREQVPAGSPGRGAARDRQVRRLVPRRIGVAVIPDHVEDRVTELVALEVGHLQVRSVG
jgi:hypothetical protein